MLKGFVLERLALEGPALERLVLDVSLDHRIRCKAVRALGQLKDPTSEAVLIKALDDDYPVVRHIAVFALARMGTNSAASELEELLGSKSNHLESIAARDEIEKSFKALKNEIDIPPLNTHSENTTRGFVFIAFLSLIIRSILINMMREARLLDKYSVELLLLQLEKLRKIALEDRQI